MNRLSPPIETMDLTVDSPTPNSLRSITFCYYSDDISQGIEICGLPIDDVLESLSICINQDNPKKWLRVLDEIPITMLLDYVEEMKGG